MRRERRQGEIGGGGDQRFKIEQFLIMPALLVIRRREYRRQIGQTLLLPKRGGGRRETRKKKRDVSPSSRSAMAYPSCLFTRTARDDILKIRERATRRGDLFRKHAELYASGKT